MGYLCANFGLPRPLCSRLRPDVRDRRQTDRRQTKASLNTPPIRGGDIIIGSIIYPVSQKTGHSTLAYNLLNIDQIFIFFSPADSAVIA